MIIVACVGYKSLNAIISNLGAIIRHWSMAYFILIVEESVIFRRRRGYDVFGWDNSHALSVGFAAMLAFCVGIAGAAVGMAKTCLLVASVLRQARINKQKAHPFASPFPNRDQGCQHAGSAPCDWLGTVSLQKLYNPSLGHQ
ncbi:hypothetical protein BKA61DRAFT_576584 [Leptodontidium sp. MPI-SDFR-AT-0119]|nr:hypothetical protein BKA61DRAFT_576584 [Leptodontidium sp. MPI-SDFR-AT-0119]